MFTTNAPAKIAGQTRYPSVRSAASAIPVGGQTGEALAWTNASPFPPPCRFRGRGPSSPAPGGRVMKQTRAPIPPSHAGSLPRPDDVIEANRARESGQASDERRFQAQLHSSVADVVRRRKDLGIAIPGDGEFGKSMGHPVNYPAWWTCSFQRLGGFDLATTRRYG